jgi:uncharacterized protein
MPLEGKFTLSLAGVERKGREEERFDVPPEALAPDPRFAVRALRVECAVSHVGGDNYYLDGTLRGATASPCARCLAEVERAFEQSFAAVLCPEGAAPGEGFNDEEADVAFYDGAAMRFAMLPFVEAEIALAFPIRALCREDCAGLCGRCGRNLNEGACGCREEAAPDPRLAPLLALRARLGRRSA